MYSYNLVNNSESLITPTPTPSPPPIAPIVPSFLATNTADNNEDEDHQHGLCTLHAGSWWGVDVKIHSTFFLLWILEVLGAQSRYHALSLTVLLFLLYGPILLMTVVLVSK